jgi:alkylation response protein AidB-like acyl-CoA dehydrogenase
MDFAFSEQQQMFRDSVAAFARKELADGALERAHAPRFPHEIAGKMAQAGLLGITLPEADGGAGGTLMDAVLAIEEVAKHCPRSADVIQEGNFGAIRVLAHFATADQKKRYLAPLLRGEEVIAVGMTEPDAGSATTDLKTTATPDGNGFRINGSKVFPYPHADQYLVYVRYGPGVEGIGSVMLRRNAPGFSIGKVSKFMSGADWAPIFFDNVYVPPEDVLLPAGGFKKQIQGFNAERIGNASRSLAYGRHCYELARRYALERKQFGRPLCEFQGLQWKFADMKMKLDAAQLLIYRAAQNADDGLPDPAEATIAKCFANETAFEVANQALQVFGAAGYSTQNPLEYYVRRTRGWMIAGGSVEMMRNRIAEHVFDRRFSQWAPREGRP